MRARRPSDDELSAVARRRLALIGEELDLLRDDPSAVEHPAAAGDRGAAPQHPPGVDTAHDEDDQDQGDQQDQDDVADAVDPAGSVPSCSVAPAGRHRRGGTGGSLLEAVGGRAVALVPGTLRGRVALTSAHLALVAVAVALALVVTTWWVVRATGEPEAPTPVTAVPAAGEPLVADTGAPTDAGAGGPADGATGGETTHAGTTDDHDLGVVVVDVAGKVRRPGIATLPVGSRVVDALEAAGGVRRGVSMTGLNLARILVDGEQVLVGVPGVAAGATPGGAAPVGGASGAPGAPVNLNTATLAELDALSGIGPVTAQAILDWRTEHGRFSAVDELLEVSGIGEKTLADLAPHVTV